MAISARFLADFSAFQSAVQKAEVTLRTLETGAGKVEKALNKMVDDFSGRKIIQDATLAAEAVQRVGGATTLTASEQAKLNAQVNEAIAKYTALGQTAPKELTDLANATKGVGEKTDQLSQSSLTAGLSLKSLFSAFTLANLASTAISKITAEVGMFVEKGLKLPAVEQSFERLSASVGQNSQKMLGALQVATKGMVSEFDLMQSANKALLLGLPVTEQSMGEMAAAATALGRAMGQDATKSLEDMITALGRSSPMILDNLGLTVKVGEANEAYAAKLGKTAEQLTDAEKKTAFYEAAMEAARKKTAELGEQTKTLGDIATTVWTSVGNIVTGAAAGINVSVGRVLSSMKEFGQFTQDMIKGGVGFALQMASMRAELEKMIVAFKNASTEGMTFEEWGALATPARDRIKELRQQLQGMREDLRALTPEQKAVIREADKLGVSAEDIAKALGLSAKAVENYTKAVKEGVKDQEAFSKRLEKIREDALKLSVAIEAAKVANERMFRDLFKPEPIQKLTQSIGEAVDMVKLYKGTLEIPPKNDLVQWWDKIHAMTDTGKNKVVEFGVALSNVIMSALTGGGNLLKSLGGFLGGSVFSESGLGLGKTIGDWVGKLSSSLGKIVGSILPGVGGVLGSLVGGLFGKLFGPTDYEKRVRQNAADLERIFKETGGHMDELRLKATMLGLNIDDVFRSRDAKWIEEVLGTLNEEHGRLQAAMEKYGITWEQLGEQAKQANIDAIAKELIQDFAILHKAGVDQTFILEKMSGAINEFVQAALRTRTEVPAAMRPMLERMIEMKQLLDENGELITDIEKIPFAKTMTEGFKDVVDAINRVAKALGYVFDTFDGRTITIPVEYLPGSGPGTSSSGDFSEPLVPFADTSSGVVAVTSNLVVDEQILARVTERVQITRLMNSQRLTRV